MIVELDKDVEASVSLSSVHVLQNRNNVEVKYKVSGEDGWFYLYKGFYKLPAKDIVLVADQTTKVVLQPAE